MSEDDVYESFELEAFKSNRVWRLVVGTIQANIEGCRDRLEKLDEIEEIKFIQGELHILHWLLGIPDILLEDEELDEVEEEMEESEEEVNG